MQITQTLNDIINIVFDPNTDGIYLLNFVLVEENDEKFLAQVIEVKNDKFDASQNLATIKIFYSINENNEIIEYDGYTPTKMCKITVCNQREIEEFVNLNKTVFPLSINPKTMLPLNCNIEFFDNNPIILADKIDDLGVLYTNILPSISELRHAVVFDYTGPLNIKNSARLRASVDFHLPLDFYSLDYIWDNAMTHAALETQAVCEDIFNEVKAYSKTLKDGFIPFNNFLRVIHAQYKQTPIKELHVLRNRLIKYQQQQIFAKNIKDIDIIGKTIANEKITVIDFSKLDIEWHREYTDFLLRTIKKDCYVFLRLNEKTTNSNLINQMYSNNTHANIVSSASYGFKRLANVLEFCNNYIFLPTLNPTRNFGEANAAIWTLTQNYALLFGKDTKNFIFKIQNMLPQKKSNKKHNAIKFELKSSEKDIKEDFLQDTKNIQETGFSQELNELMLEETISGDEEVKDTSLASIQKEFEEDIEKDIELQTAKMKAEMEENLRIAKEKEEKLKEEARLEAAKLAQEQEAMRLNEEKRLKEIEEAKRKNEALIKAQEEAKEKERLEAIKREEEAKKREEEAKLRAEKEKEEARLKEEKRIKDDIIRQKMQEQIKIKAEKEKQERLQEAHFEEIKRAEKEHIKDRELSENEKRLEEKFAKAKAEAKEKNARKEIVTPEIEENKAKNAPDISLKQPRHIPVDDFEREMLEEQERMRVKAEEELRIKLAKARAEADAINGETEREKFKKQQELEEIERLREEEEQKAHEVFEQKIKMAQTKAQEVKADLKAKIEENEPVNEIELERQAKNELEAKLAHARAQIENEQKPVENIEIQDETLGIDLDVIDNLKNNAQLDNDDFEISLDDENDASLLDDIAKQSLEDAFDNIVDDVEEKVRHDQETEAKNVEDKSFEDISDDDEIDLGNFEIEVEEQPVLETTERIIESEDETPNLEVTVENPKVETIEIKEEIPIYTDDNNDIEAVSGDFVQGDKVEHEKYGTGTIVRIIKYANRSLLQIEFDEIGKRLLDPAITELKKI